MKYHAHPQGEHLPPEMWQTAPDWQRILEACKHFRPPVIYTQKGSLRHPNGTPMIVTKNNIEWSPKP